MFQFNSFKIEKRIRNFKMISERIILQFPEKFKTRESMCMEK